jgi:CheY-like chemotaxis protein
VPAASPPGLGSLPPLRVLLADDAPLNRELLVDMLVRHGHAVAATADGAELLARAALEPFDLLLLDIHMPVMDGEEAIRRLRASEGPNRLTPAIALTANVVEADRRRYLAAGMDRCLGKPVAWGELAAVIAELVTPARSARPPEPGPVDWRFVGEVLAGMPAERRTSYLARALAEARACLAELACRRGEPEAVAAIAHRLKGTARSFGLVAVGACAEAVELAARDGRDMAIPLADLERAVAATAAALAGETRHGGGP